MERWFYSKSRKKRKRKKDDFWSEYLRRDCKDNNGMININNRNKQPKNLNDCQNQHQNQQKDISNCDRSQYKSNVFNQIFGKKFESKTIRTVKRLSSEPQTYHFCVK